MNTHYPIHCGMHLSLGAMQRDYIPLFMKGANNPEVMRGVLLRPPITLEAELAWYDNLVKARGETDVVLAILLHEQVGEDTTITYRYIGHTGLHGISWPNGRATTGSIIIDKTCFGKGYGTEAKMLLLYEAFRNRGLRKVCSNVKAFNGNSWGHLLACGYREVGRHKRHHFYDGTYVDDIEFEVFREEWEPIWDAYVETKKIPRLTDEQRALLQKEIGPL